ncbi:hypothetical protein E2C01_073147 [Portunus trituberculatus]|uniref:Uncharacterized protein n=1 Tax=Portunus trituberculatus TaxID=210409 RepID=A0A5B7I4F3_PORTR|nr:hypothetical protein [Portunus trituberculatus]
MALALPQVECGSRVPGINVLIPCDEEALRARPDEALSCVGVTSGSVERYNGAGIVEHPSFILLIGCVRRRHNTRCCVSITAIEKLRNCFDLSANEGECVVPAIVLKHCSVLLASYMIH